LQPEPVASVLPSGENATGVPHLCPARIAPSRHLPPSQVHSLTVCSTLLAASTFASGENAMPEKNSCGCPRSVTCIFPLATSQSVMPLGAVAANVLQSAVNATDPFSS